MADQKVKALLFMKAHSERVPGKNMRSLCGRPLFHWILDTLTKSKYVNEIIINTDSDEIAESAMNNYEVTIHMRPNKLLEINSDEPFQLMNHDLELTDGDYFIQTHSTNPLIKPETIDRSIETYFNNNEKYDSLFSVTAVQKRYYWQDGNPINHNPSALIRTQDLPYIFEENSCIYIFSRTVFLECMSRIGVRPYFFQIDSYESIDIDEEIDFLFAELLMNERLLSEKKPVN